MIISIDSGKSFDKVLNPFMTKSFSIVGVCSIPQHTKDIYKTPTSNSILSGQNIKTSPLRSKIRQGCLLPSLLFNIVLEVPGTVIRQEKEIKGIQIGKEEVKLSLFADDMIAYIENPIDSTKKLFDLISKFGKTVRYKVNIQKLKAFLYTMKYQKQKLGKKVSFAIATRNVKYLGMNITKEVKDL